MLLNRLLSLPYTLTNRGIIQDIKSEANSISNSIATAVPTIPIKAAGAIESVATILPGTIGQLRSAI